MRKIGVIFCAYNNAELLGASLQSWIGLRAKICDEIIISAVSVPFLEYKDLEIKPDNTLDLLRDYQANNFIQHLVDSPLFIKEHEARDLSLQFLLAQGCTDIVLWDLDEVASVDQLDSIVAYVRQNSYISWFNFSYKNYVFDKKTYLLDPFTPPRWFKVETNGYKLKCFHWDNDLTYSGTVVNLNSFQNRLISYKELPSKIIPSSTVWISHYSWLNDRRSMAKVKYQQAHFGACSYGWDEERGLVFDASYFKTRGLSEPQVEKDS